MWIWEGGVKFYVTHHLRTLFPNTTFKPRRGMTWGWFKDPFITGLTMIHWWTWIFSCGGLVCLSILPLVQPSATFELECGNRSYRGCVWTVWCPCLCVWRGVCGMGGVVQPCPPNPDDFVTPRYLLTDMFAQRQNHSPRLLPISLWIWNALLGPN